MLIHAIASCERRELQDALVVPFFKEAENSCDLGDLLELVQGPIKAKDFAGKPSEICCVWGNEPQEKRLFLLGLGDKEKCSLEVLRRAYGACAKFAQKFKCKSLNILLPEVALHSHEAVVKASLEGLLSASYLFDALKNVTLEKEPSVRLEELTLIGREVHATTKAAEHTLKVMEAVYRARDLVNGNADDITPHYLAQFAKEITQEFPRIKTEIKDRAWMEKEQMGLLLAVSRAAAVEPAFIISSYTGQPASSDHTVLVGKGITYDTGGLVLKTSEGMETMRCDMTGAAIVLATIQACAALNLPINVTAVVPSCENAISAQSYKLGDVYKSRSGITVEVTNTDAEGRLVLADALDYAQEVLKPSRIIDLGTLTGAIEIALGSELMGLFANSDSLAEELLHSGQRTFERLWRMPLYEEYKKALDSDVADTKNAATRKGGSILCAIFLQKFIKDIPWAHIDIAGVSFAKESSRYLPKQATGVGVRFLVDYFEHLAKNVE